MHRTQRDIITENQNSREIQMLPVNTTLDTLKSDIGQQVRALLLEDGTLSARALAGRVGCSPTTASKWKSRIASELIAK